MRRLLLVAIIAGCQVLAAPTNPALKIIGGSEVREGEFRFAVWIKFTFRLNPHCTGSVISPKWVLTAAHCVVSTNGRVLPASVFQVGVGHNVFYAKPFEVNTVITHPDYLNPKIYPDAALLELRTSVSVESVYIPSVEEETRSASPGTIATLIGGGFTSSSGDIAFQLMKASFSILSNCPVQRVAESAMCLDASYDRTAAEGDSGGPLVVRLPSEEWGQVGIAKAGGGPPFTTATRTSVIRNWIKEHVPLADPQVTSPLDSENEYDRWFSRAARDKCLEREQGYVRDDEYITTCKSLNIIVQGGAWSTEIEIRNTHSTKESAYELLIRSDDPRGLYVRGPGIEGWTKTIEGRLPPRGVHSYDLDREDVTATIQAEVLVIHPKYEDGNWNVEDPRLLSRVRSLITQYVPGRPPFQQNLSARWFFNNRSLHNVLIPYRDDGPYTTAVAYTSLLGIDKETRDSVFYGWARYWVQAYDEQGKSLCGQDIWAPSLEDRKKTFLVNTLLPCTKGRKGYLTFSHTGIHGQKYGFAGISVLVFHDQGAFFAY